MEKEYIQLPALKRDLDPDVVKALWAFIQLPEEYQARYQEQYELLNQRKEEADRQLQENIEKIDADAIHLYEETMRSMIRDIVQQSCNLACWVRYHKYDLEESLEEMIDQAKGRTGAKLILMEPFVFPKPLEYAAWEEPLSEFREEMRRLAGKYGTGFVPLWDMFREAQKRYAADTLTTDGIHLTEKGHRLLAAAWLKTYEEL